MVGGPVSLGMAISHAVRGYIGLDTDDRLDTRCLRGAVEFDGPKHSSVIGES